MSVVWDTGGVLWQVDLTPAMAKEEITRVLTASDPNLPNNITKYNFREKVFKVDPPGALDQLAMHFEMNGCVKTNPPISPHPWHCPADERSLQVCDAQRISRGQGAGRLRPSGEFYFKKKGGLPSLPTPPPSLEVLTLQVKEAQEDAHKVAAQAAADAGEEPDEDEGGALPERPRRILGNLPRRQPTQAT